jgi:hypothetical protein
VIAISILITRIAATALMHTGLTKEHQEAVAEQRIEEEEREDPKRQHPHQEN